MLRRPIIPASRGNWPQSIMNFHGFMHHKFRKEIILLQPPVSDPTLAYQPLRLWPSWLVSRLHSNGWKSEFAIWQRRPFLGNQKLHTHEWNSVKKSGGASRYQRQDLGTQTHRSQNNSTNLHSDGNVQSTPAASCIILEIRLTAALRLQSFWIFLFQMDKIPGKTRRRGKFWIHIIYRCLYHKHLIQQNSFCVLTPCPGDRTWTRDEGPALTDLPISGRDGSSMGGNINK